MKTIDLKVTNARLGLELNLHLVSGAYAVDSANKRIIGQINSFKSDKIQDAMHDNGELRPALVSQFIIEDIDLSKPIDKQISDYIDKNLSKIVER